MSSRYLVIVSSTSERKVIKNKILNAGIIYVGGGNTLRMMNLWRHLGIDRLVNKAREKRMHLVRIKCRLHLLVSSGQQ
jgi:peptidase E